MSGNRFDLSSTGFRPNKTENAIRFETTDEIQIKRTGNTTSPGGTTRAESKLAVQRYDVIVAEPQRIQARLAHKCYSDRVGRQPDPLSVRDDTINLRLALRAQKASFGSRSGLTYAAGSSGQAQAAMEPAALEWESLGTTSWW